MFIQKKNKVIPVNQNDFIQNKDSYSNKENNYLLTLFIIIAGISIFIYMFPLTIYNTMKITS